MVNQWYEEKLSLYLLISMFFHIYKYLYISIMMNLYKIKLSKRGMRIIS